MGLPNCGSAHMDASAADVDTYPAHVDARPAD
jgi:hypothetical protein